MLPGPEDYWLVIFLFQRALAVIYLAAFLVAANQFRPLAGEDGLLPIGVYVEAASFSERPPQWAPYHLRLDWQLWFAAMRPRPTRRQRWLFVLLEALLEHDDATLDLIADAPFEDAPEIVRVTRYRYRFTTPAERAETREWWHRERVGTYVAPVALDELRSRGATPRRSVF